MGEGKWMDGEDTKKKKYSVSSLSDVQVKAMRWMREVFFFKKRWFSADLDEVVEVVLHDEGAIALVCVRRLPGDINKENMT